METFINALYEIYVAWNGGDWGYGALADLLGNDALALAIVNL